MNSTGKENKVSVVLPVYNAEVTIVTAVKSVINQTYKDWELIIIDDGSKDKSVAYLQEFIDKQDTELKVRIKLITQENRGPSYTRNVGINVTEGAYITFLDSDDAWVADKLNIQINYFNKFRSIGIVAGGFNKKLFEDGIKFKEITYSQLLYRNYFITPTVMIRKDVLDLEKTFFDENKTYCEDQDLWLRITNRLNGIYVNEILAKNITGKANFGEKGLSSNLVLMYKGEVANYFSEYKNRRITWYKLITVLIFSFIKFCRRKWITNF